MTRIQCNGPATDGKLGNDGDVVPICPDALGLQCVSVCERVTGKFQSMLQRRSRRQSSS